MPKHIQTDYQGYQGYGANPMPAPRPANDGISEVAAALGAQQGYADMLRPDVFDSSPKGIAEGIAQLGKAWMYRGAQKKTGELEKEYASEQQRAQSDQIAALLGDNADPRMAAAASMNPDAVVSALIAQEIPSYGDQTGRLSYEHSVAADDRDHNYRVNRDAVEDKRAAESAERSAFESDREYQLNKDGMELRAQELENDAGSIGAPGLAGLPSGVQSAIVREEQGILDAAAARSEAARKAARLSAQFMTDAEKFGALGGGPLADIGQAFSNKTAGLKGVTAEMIPMMRTAGEGIMTDADAKRYESAVVSVNKPRSSNQSVADVHAAVEKNAVQNEQFLRKYQATYGYGSLRDAQMLWDEYSESHPIFDPESGKPKEQRMDPMNWMRMKELQAKRAAGTLEQ